MKRSRIGYTKALMIAIAAMASIDPCPIGLVVPTDDDARDYVVDDRAIVWGDPELAGPVYYRPAIGPQHDYKEKIYLGRDLEDPVGAGAAEAQAA